MVLAQVSGLFGAGVGTCWRRCRWFLAQVRKKWRDLRHCSAQRPILRRRSLTKNPTCTKNRAHLRQKLGIPAPSAFFLRSNGPTCTKNRAHLRQKLGIPAPSAFYLRSNGPTCAKNGAHLLQKLGIPAPPVLYLRLNGPTYFYLVGGNHSHSRSPGPFSLPDGAGGPVILFTFPTTRCR